MIISTIKRVIENKFLLSFFLLMCSRLIALFPYSHSISELIKFIKTLCTMLLFGFMPSGTGIQKKYFFIINYIIFLLLKDFFYFLENQTSWKICNFF